MRKLRWETHEPTGSRHPYRDSAIVYGALAIVIVVVAGVTGGSFLKGLAWGAGFFAAATAWNWWRFHEKEKSRRREEERQ